jgi:CheY-like chemotaxis protein
MTAVPPTPLPVADALTTRPVILVVDDTGGVRSVLTRALLDSGYHVITSAGETEALRVLDQFQTRPDLAVLDLYMPLGSGEALGRKLLDRHPSLPLVFLSAFGHDPDAVLPGLLFEKPFQLAVLCTAIAHVLEVGMAAVVGGTG